MAAKKRVLSVEPLSGRRQRCLISIGHVVETGEEKRIKINGNADTEFGVFAMLHRAKDVLLSRKDTFQAQMVEHCIKDCAQQNQIAKLKNDFNQLEFEHRRLRCHVWGVKESELDCYDSQDRYEPDEESLWGKTATAGKPSLPAE